MDRDMERRTERRRDEGMNGGHIRTKEHKGANISMNAISRVNTEFLQIFPSQI